MVAHTNPQGHRRPLLHGVEAYAFPLVLMDLTKEQMTVTTAVGQFTTLENKLP